VLEHDADRTLVEALSAKGVQVHFGGDDAVQLSHGQV